MARLPTRGPSDDLLPVTIGEATLSEAPAARVTWIAPFRGRADEVAQALGGLPDPGRWRDAGALRIVATAPGQWTVLGEVDPPDGIAVTDQSDAWFRLILSSDSAADILARLVPADLRGAEPGWAARTLLGHVSITLLRDTEGWEIWAPRSMAGTVLHDLARAMRSIAGRRAL